MRVWDLKGTPSATVLEGHSDGCSQHCCVGHEDLQRVMEDKTIRVWDISTLTHTHTPGWPHWWGDQPSP